MSFPPRSYISEQEINELRSMVARYFPVYSTGMESDSLVFFCEVNENDLESKFNSLRADARKKGYVPVIKESHGEYMIYLAPFRRKEGRGVWVNLVMLILAIITTSFAGVLHWASYSGDSNIYSSSNIVNGILYFALPLLVILGTHEMGHYFMARKRDVHASLPFFMPFMPPLGTMGAFISLREPIPDKKTLLDIGIAGPIAGFIVAVPVTIIGMMLGAANPPSGGIEPGGSYVNIQVPLIYSFLSLFFPTGSFMHPTAFAGWVGFIVTAINLFPAGQLDGGHIARALLGEKAKYASYGSLIVLFLIGVFTNYWGWIIFGSLIFFLGIRHAPPLNDISPLDSKRKILGVLAAVMLAISFVPVPMSTYTPVVGVSIEPMDPGAPLNITAEAGSHVYFDFTVANTGELNENITISVISTGRWNSTVFVHGNSSYQLPPFLASIESGCEMNYTLDIEVPANASPYLYDVSILASVASESDELHLRILVPGNRSASMFILPQNAYGAPEDDIPFDTQISSLSENQQNISFSVVAPRGWSVDIADSGQDSMHIRLEPYQKMNFTFMVHIPNGTENGSYAVVVVLSSQDGTISSTYLDITVVQERSST